MVHVSLGYLFLVSWILGVYAQNKSTTTCTRKAKQQTAPSIPTNVYLSILVTNVAKIDGVEESFVMDFFLSAYWYDPDLNNTDPNFEYDLLSNFNPQIDFQNFVEPPTKFVQPEDVAYTVLTNPSDFIQANDSYFSAKKGMWMQYGQRYAGSFRTKLGLKDFPFDIQDATVIIDSAAWASSDVVFKAARPDRFLTDLSTEALSLSEWDYQQASYQETLRFYPAFNNTYSQFKLSLTFKRLPQYYLLKIVSGVILLVFMSIFIYSLTVQEADRMMGTLSIYLGIIQFVFIGSQSLPKVPYNTRIDTFLAFSFIISSLMFVSHAILYFYRPEDDDAEEEGEKAEKSSDEKKQGDRAVHLAIGVQKNNETKEEEHDLFTLFGLPTWKSRTGQRKMDLILSILFAVTYAIGTGSILRK